MTPSPVLPDTILDAIDRAARQVKRRANGMAYDAHNDDGPPTDSSLDAFTEDLTDELTVPIGEIVMQRDDCLVIMTHVRSLIEQGKGAETIGVLGRALETD